MPASLHQPSTTRPRPSRPRLVTFLLLTLLSLWFGACSTPSGGSKQFAAVTLRGHEAEAIRKTVAAVFSEKGYIEASRPGLWCYERGSSTMGQLLYGGWFAEEGVRERAKLSLIPLTEGVYRLDCEAVMVRDAGDSFFEEEASMTRLKSGPYKKMLAEVEQRLQRP